jgi:hypothetical protein
MAGPRPHIILRGLGDRYLSHGEGRVTCNGVPMADVPVVKPKEKPVPARGPALDLAATAALERERALLGALIMGWRSVDEVDEEIRQISHRQILDTLVAVLPGLPDGRDRLPATVDVCRVAGLDPVLCGRRDGEVVFGYLKGCVRSARLAGLDMDAVHGLGHGAREDVRAENDAGPALANAEPQGLVVTDAMIDELAAQPTEDEAEAWER